MRAIDEVQEAKDRHGKTSTEEPEGTRALPQPATSAKAQGQRRYHWPENTPRQGRANGATRKSATPCDMPKAVAGRASHSAAMLPFRNTRPASGGRIATAQVGC